jgi:ribosome-binding factor A
MPAADLFADDLQNAEDVFRKPFRNKSDRKVLQLCRQVQRAISFTLGGECRDPVLQDLVVESVTPAPDASRLAVMVYLAESAQEAEEAGNPPPVSFVELLERLERAKPLFRREVAAAITRKRAPELVFQIVRPKEVMP